MQRIRQVLYKRPERERERERDRERDRETQTEKERDMGIFRRGKKKAKNMVKRVKFRGERK